ncbi:MAG: trigger factor [Candidatus Vogelbacteria bacterium]|nr:trigger factor [Candidatus Vogelbacteria bacterium]
MTVEIKKLENSEVEITGEIAAADFESFRQGVMEEFRRDLEVPGFRKGHAPDSVISEKVGNEKILYEMAEQALSHYYPEIVRENKLDAIGRPEITITKIAAGNPLGFKVKTAVMPEMKLPDYQKIAKKENAKPAEPAEVTETEIDEVINEIRKNRAHDKYHADGHENKEGEEVPLPELTDEFAKTLGNFESVVDLRTKVGENVGLDKKRRNAEKKRLTIMEEIIKGSTVDLPRALIESELGKMEHDMRAHLESMGLKFEDYLSHLKKTIEEMRQDWEPEAIKRAKFGLILTKVAETEKIEADPKELEHESKHLLDQYQDADPERIRAYIEGMLKNEATFKFLENC